MNHSRVLLMGMAIAVSGIGCLAGNIDLGYTCQNPDKGHKDPYGMPDPCHYNDPDTGIALDAGPVVAAATGVGADACTGACSPAAPSGWGPPALLWFGDESNAPSCPDRAPTLGYRGYTDLKRPFGCGSCSCDPPTGTCGLPTTITASSTSQCPSDPFSATMTPFNPPSPWDGSCTALGAVPALAVCSGGVPCVQSLTIGPLSVHETECRPSLGSPVVPKNLLSSWGTYAVECLGSGICLSSGELCTPTPDAFSGGFQQCIFHEGDVACPTDVQSTYTHKHVFYGDFADTRTCTPCTCGAPTGGVCKAEISIFADAVCSAAIHISTPVDSNADLCIGVLPGSALGSKSARQPTYTPGACRASGGAVLGTVTPTEPTTFCCTTS